MRVIGGSLRGLKLADIGAGDLGARLRPTSDRVREAMFNLLQNGRGGNSLPGARVLDLFAGTGALGIEALSRGAAFVTFVDNGAAAHTLIRRNVERVRMQGSSEIWRHDATQLGTNRGAAYTLAILDPPYGKDLGEAAIASALAGGWLAPGAVVMWEENGPPRVPAPLQLLDQRRYGTTVVLLARLPDQAAAGG